jgi:hydroxymethylbilane synthase
MTSGRPIVVGTRGSRLALWQADWVSAEIRKRNPGPPVSLKKIRTSGDRITDVPLAEVGGKGLFVKEIEEELLRGEIDLAVHSMKDIPAEIPKGLHFPAMSPREDPRDVLISREHKRLSELPSGARIGTGSLRRRAQLLERRPDLVVVPVRGNLDTRLRKLKSGQYDAIVVAAAGILRMGWEKEIAERLDPEISLPAVGQGVMGIECREEDREINALLQPLNDPLSSVVIGAERAVLNRLQGGCQVPLAAYAVVESGGLWLRGLVASLDGKRIIRAEERGSPGDPRALGERLAEKLLENGAGEFLGR